MKEISFRLLMPGLPYKTRQGGLGYSSISLVSDNSENILFDVGHYAVREKMIKISRRYKISKIFLSHLHYDHCLNIDLFLHRGLKIYLHKKEWDYIKAVRNDDIYTFRFFNKIVKRKDIILFNEEFNISPRVRVKETIGHTAGHSSLTFRKDGQRYIIAGDAIKTYRDFKNIRQADVAPYNLRRFLATKKYIIDNFDVIVPGHSNIIKNGKPLANRLSLKSF